MRLEQTKWGFFPDDLQCLLFNCRLLNFIKFHNHGLNYDHQSNTNRKTANQVETTQKRNVTFIKINNLSYDSE